MPFDSNFKGLNFKPKFNKWFDGSTDLIIFKVYRVSGYIWIYNILLWPDMIQIHRPAGVFSNLIF